MNTKLTRRQLKELNLEKLGIKYKKKAHFSKEQAEIYKQKLQEK